MRTVAVPALDRLVRNEPRVAAAANAVSRRAPPSDVRLILIRHTEREAIERRRAVRREVEDELLTVVQEAIAVDRLVVADREIPGQAGGRARGCLLDRNRF